MPAIGHRPLVWKLTYRPSPSVREKGAKGWLLIRSTGYVVIELKTGKFQPEYAGKLNFYVALVDDVLRRDHHNETIGILICGTKNDRSVRYSLGRSTSPMAVAAYTYDKLPPAEQQALPDEGHLVAALEWAEPDADAEAGQTDTPGVGK